MSTNNDARARAFSEADRQMVRPTVELRALLTHAGATKDILSFREVMYYLGQYIMKKQLYDQTDLHIVHCSQDALGKIMGVERFSVKETGPLYRMITNNLVLVGTQEPSSASQHSQPDRPSDRPPDRPPEVKIQESSCTVTQSQPLPERSPEDSDAGSSHSISGSRRRRRSEPGPSHRDDAAGEDEDGERKRRRADSYSLTFDNSMSWCVIEELRNGQDRVRHSSQSSDANSFVSNRSDMSDHFSVEFEVDSIESDNDDDVDEETSLSDDDQVYEVTVYEDDDDTDEDTEITEADYWRCLKCEELNPPLPRNCNRCWSLRQDWLRDVLPRAIPSTNPSPLPPTPSPGPPKPPSAECPGAEEEGMDVPDGRRTTPIPPCETQSSQEFSQTSSILSSTHPAADAGSDLCVICQSEPKNGCIVHGKTGHLMACFKCARKLKRRNKVCPVCREPIEAVVKTFFC